MRVTSYGLFWWRDQVEWGPGGGTKFELLGHKGEQKRTLRMSDFRHQRGIYILYDRYGPSYVGLTRDMGLGARLKNHDGDPSKGNWDRFSWFGFRKLRESKEQKRFFDIEQDEFEEITDNMETTIGDLEALMIWAIGPKKNKRYMGFSEAEEWEQIFLDDRQKYYGMLPTRP